MAKYFRYRATTLMHSKYTQKQMYVYELGSVLIKKQYVSLLHSARAKSIDLWGSQNYLSNKSGGNKCKCNYIL